MRKPYRMMTEEQVEEALRCRRAGMSFAAIGSAYGVSESQVRNKTERLRHKQALAKARALHSRRNGVAVSVAPVPQSTMTDLCKPISGKATASFVDWGDLSMGNIGRGK